jgi:hypothetical protein
MMQSIIELSCVYCGKSFEANRKTARYCSDTCKTYASQEKTGRREKKGETVSGIAVDIESLKSELADLEVERIDLESQIKEKCRIEHGYYNLFDKNGELGILPLRMQLFNTLRNIHSIYSELIDSGSRFNLTGYSQNIPLYPFDFHDIYPLNALYRATYPFIGYVCRGDKKGNTNLLLRFAGVLTLRFEFKVLYVVESLKKFNAGFPANNDDDCFAFTIADEHFKVKTIKDRMDIEKTVKESPFDFLLLDAENINIDYDFLHSLQVIAPNMSIICTTIKPVLTIIDEADYVAKITENDDGYTSFSNTFEHGHYGINHDSYFGTIPEI